MTTLLLLLLLLLVVVVVVVGVAVVVSVAVEGCVLNVQGFVLRLPAGTRFIFSPNFPDLLWGPMCTWEFCPGC
jgi:hypothetical protein